MKPASLITEFSLEGHAFVVTGASSGIGRAMAGFLCEAGASVILIARRETALIQVADQLTEAGYQAAFVTGDLTYRESLGDLAARCRQPFGPISGIINAAGINPRQPVEKVTLETWDQTLNLNLSVPFFFTREFIQDMKNQRYGRILNIASLQSSRAFANGLPYGASKGGICQLTRAMAEAWSRYGIMSNAIAPGFFPTELTAPVFADAETAGHFAAQTTVGRNGQLDDLKGATIFFASNACRYITGQTLYVDGGFTAR